MNNKNIAILTIGILVLAILVLVIFKGNDMWKWIKEKCCCFGKEEKKERKEEEKIINNNNGNTNQQPRIPYTSEEDKRDLAAIQESLQNMIAGTDRIEKIDNDIESSLKKTEELLTDFIVADAKATINKK